MDIQSRLAGGFSRVFMAALVSSLIKHSSQALDVLGLPAIRCMDDRVEFTFETSEKFKGRVFVNGRDEDANCAKDYSSGALGSVVIFTIPFGQCGLERTFSDSTNGGAMEISATVTLVISFHSVFITKQDKAYMLQCRFPMSDRKVSQQMDVSTITATALPGTASDFVNCSYTLHKDHPGGPTLNLAVVGEQMFHVWLCESSMPDLGLLVYDCDSRDHNGRRIVKTIDSKGCTIDTQLIGHIQYNESGMVAMAPANVYKYDNLPSVFFYCSIRLCRKSVGECDRISPPLCSEPDSTAVITDSPRTTWNPISTLLAQTLVHQFDAVPTAPISSGSNHRIIEALRRSNGRPSSNHLHANTHAPFHFYKRRRKRSRFGDPHVTKPVGATTSASDGTEKLKIRVNTRELKIMDRTEDVEGKIPGTSPRKQTPAASSFQTTGEDEQVMQTRIHEVEIITDRPLVPSIGLSAANSINSAYNGPLIRQQQERCIDDANVCVPTAIFGVMAISTLLAFVLATLLAATAFAKVAARHVYGDNCDQNLSAATVIKNEPAEKRQPSKQGTISSQTETCQRRKSAKVSWRPSFMNGLKVWHPMATDPYRQPLTAYLTQMQRRESFEVF